MGFIDNIVQSYKLHAELDGLPRVNGTDGISQYQNPNMAKIYQNNIERLRGKKPISYAAGELLFLLVGYFKFSERPQKSNK